MLVLFFESEGTLEIASYIERLNWVHIVSIDEEFRDLDGSHRLAVIAVAVLFGPEAALRVWRDAILWMMKSRICFWAQRELIFMVEHDRGNVVEFKAQGSAP